MAALFRVCLTPLDTFKTTLQTRPNAYLLLKHRYQQEGLSSFYYGAMGNATAAIMSHYPWFTTYHFLQQQLPLCSVPYLRNGFIGMCSSMVGDITCNSIRVLKTFRQTHPQKISYLQAFHQIPFKSLLTRGLKTRLMVNGIQGLLFSVLWNVFQERFA